jgi:D-xylulose reductase
MGQPEVTVPITLMLTKELTVKGSFRYGVCFYILIPNYIHTSYTKPGDYRLAIALVAQKKIDLKPLVTHRWEMCIFRCDPSEY